MNIYKNYKNTLTQNSLALRNVSTGKKINSAKDNPNKIGEVQGLSIGIRAREAAIGNIQNTNSMIQTFDGAMQEMNNNMSRLKQLTVRASNETNTEDELKVIQKEIDEIKESMNDLANNTTFNGIKLSDNTVTDNNDPSYRLSQIGALEHESVEIPFFNLSTKGLGIDDIDVTDPDSLEKSLSSVDLANVQISTARAKYGALQINLEAAESSTSEINEVYSRAQSSIEDADLAEEMLEISRTNILTQSAISLMAQSNQFPRDALNILSNVR